MKRRTHITAISCAAMLAVLTLLVFLVFSGERSGSGGSSAAPIAWGENYEEAVERAGEDGKLVLMEFFAEWCGACEAMERTTFADDRVRDAVGAFVPLKVDVDKQPHIAQLYGIESLPTTVIVEPSGEPVAGVVGYMQSEDFLEWLATPPSEG